MGEKVIVGPVNRGYRTDREPFVIDNDNFPTLINAYQWRGRLKRKRGTALLGRLQRYIGTTNGAGNLVVTILPIPIPTGISSFTIGSDVFVDPGGASPVNLLTNSAGTGVLDRVTGVLTITGSQINTAVLFFPTLPVMGLEDLILEINQFPGTLAFDTKYSYNITPTSPFRIYDVSFYKNPASGSFPGYVQKTTPTPTTWNGQDYRQFWTVNYQGALWATNGIDISPTTLANIGMQFKPITNIVIDAVGPPALATLTIVAHGLVQGDFVFINEVQGVTGINFQTGYVVSADPQAANTVQVEFPNATLGGAYVPGSIGMAQYLTNRSDVTKDCLRWYDGDPTNGQLPPSFVPGKGWVNFAPPLNFLTAFPNFSVLDLIPAQYYLVGARIILPFKDRLLFFGPIVQTSTGSPIYVQDAVVYSQNGTAFYTVSYTNSPNAAIDTPASPTNVFHPILVPTNQTASSAAYLEDFTGFGGFIIAGIDRPITTASPNEDVIIVGFDRLQTRLVYSGNDIVPFNFFSINSELGSSSTFSVINMDKGVITRGNRGYTITSQVESQRIDLEISDQVFQTKLSNNGAERITAQRDYINEWIYFTYLSNEVAYNFPNQTLQYNYRDDSWAIFNETYTTYGQFRQASGNTWATIGQIYPTWSQWNVPWNAGATTLFQPKVIAGNQQGYVLFRDDGTGEANSLYIQNISGTTITSPNHCLNENDYITITGVTGTVASQVNGKIFSVVTPTANTFLLNPSIAGGTYTGGGQIQRMYVPLIQSKQFPVSWGMARKTRLGVQQYLITTTARSQMTLLIFLSQDSDYPYNLSNNNGLIYSTVLYTCPESTNLGLTPFNTNLQMLADPQTGITTQSQIWHRVNTSLLGDTVQVGFTLSDAQMRTLDDLGRPISQFSEIEIHGFILDCSPSQILA